MRLLIPSERGPRERHERDAEDDAGRGAQRQIGTAIPEPPSAPSSHSYPHSYSQQPPQLGLLPGAGSAGSTEQMLAIISAAATAATTAAASAMHHHASMMGRYGGAVAGVHGGQHWLSYAPRGDDPLLGRPIPRPAAEHLGMPVPHSRLVAVYPHQHQPRQAAEREQEGGLRVIKLGNPRVVSKRTVASPHAELLPEFRDIVGRPGRDSDAAEPEAEAAARQIQAPSNRHDEGIGPGGSASSEDPVRTEEEGGPRRDYSGNLGYQRPTQGSPKPPFLPPGAATKSGTPTKSSSRAVSPPPVTRHAAVAQGNGIIAPRVRMQSPPPRHRPSRPQQPDAEASSSPRPMPALTPADVAAAPGPPVGPPPPPRQSLPQELKDSVSHALEVIQNPDSTRGHKAAAYPSVLEDIESAAAER